MAELVCDLLVDARNRVGSAVKHGSKRLRTHLGGALPQDDVEGGPARSLAGLGSREVGHVEAEDVAHGLDCVEKEHGLRMHPVSCIQVTLGYLHVLSSQSGHVLGCPQGEVLGQELGSRHERSQIRERYQPLGNRRAWRKRRVQEEAEEGLRPCWPQAHHVEPQELHTSCPVSQQHCALENPQESRHEAVLHVAHGAREAALEILEHHHHLRIEDVRHDVEFLCLSNLFRLIRWRLLPCPEDVHVGHVVLHLMDGSVNLHHASHENAE
mmetsp:Transcript_90064/g.226630  ORF Transcript_90064/g.226630 Transcript_90064/m.226630 type:complete len:268 (+) Transcript_90064:635-1438(+)